MRMGVVYRVRLRWREAVGIMWLGLGGRWQWMVGQGMGVWVGVTAWHGVLLVGRWFMVGLIVLVVETALPFHEAAPSTCVTPARWGMMTLAGRAMMGQREASDRRTLA